MSNTINVPWERYALIAKLSKKMKVNGGHLGKTSLMKLIYFLQTLKGVNLTYSFNLYTYGPFASEVLGDLDYTATLGGVQVTFQRDGYGYDIQPDDPADNLFERASGFLAANGGAIDEIVEEFGRYNAKELELLSTIVFVDRSRVESENKFNRASLAETVHAIKPHFEIREVEEKIDLLASEGHIVNLN